MALLKKGLGVLLIILSGLAAMVLLMVTPLFHDGSPDYPAWRALNMVMAVMVVVALVIACTWKYRLHKSEPGSALHAGCDQGERSLPGDDRLDDVVLLGVVLDVEPRERDGGCGNVPPDLLSIGGRVVRGNHPH